MSNLRKKSNQLSFVASSSSSSSYPVDEPYCFVPVAPNFQEKSSSWECPNVSKNNSEDLKTQDCACCFCKAPNLHIESNFDYSGEDLRELVLSKRDVYNPLLKYFAFKYVPYKAAVYRLHDNSSYVVDIFRCSSSVEHDSEYVTSYFMPVRWFCKRTRGGALDLAISMFKWPNAPQASLEEIRDAEQMLHGPNKFPIRYYFPASTYGSHTVSDDEYYLEMLQERIPVWDAKCDPIDVSSFSTRDSVYNGAFGSKPFLAAVPVEHPHVTRHLRYRDMHTAAVLAGEDNPSAKNSLNKAIASIKSEMSKFALSFSPHYNAVYKNPYTKGYLARTIFAPGSAADKFISRNEQVMDQIQIWISFIYMTFQAKDASDMYALLYLFLSTQGVAPIDKMVFSASMALLKGVSSIHGKFIESDDDMQTESFDDIAAPITGPMKKFVSVMNMSIDSCATDALKDLLVSASALKMFSPGVAVGIRRWFGKSKSDTAFGLIQDLVNALMGLTRIGELIAADVPFSEAIFQADPTLAMINRARKVLLYKNRTYTGLPLDGHMDLVSYLKEAEEIRKYFDLVLKKMSPASRHYRESNSCFLELTDSVLEKKSAMNARKRAAPMGIIVCGSPGVGKSSIMDYIVNLMSSVRGRTHLDTLTYTRQKEEFWENYSEETPYIRYPELASTHVNIVAHSGDVWLDEICAVIDSLPYAVSMAFEKKGKVFAVPELVIADTNTKHLNAHKAVNNKAAIERRFLYIEPIVLDDYKDGETPMLDPSKVEKARAVPGFLPMNLWKFNVSIKKARSATESQEIFLLRNGNIHELTDLLVTRMKAHIARATDYSAVLAALDLSKYGKDRFGVIEHSAVETAAIGFRIITELLGDRITQDDEKATSECLDGFVFTTSIPRKDVRVKFLDMCNEMLANRFRSGDGQRAAAIVDRVLNEIYLQPSAENEVKTALSVDAVSMANPQSLVPLVNVINAGLSEEKRIDVHDPTAAAEIANFAHNLAQFVEDEKDIVDEKGDIVQEAGEEPVPLDPLPVRMYNSACSAATWTFSPFRVAYHYCRYSGYALGGLFYNLLLCAGFGTFDLLLGFILFFNPARMSINFSKFVYGFRTFSLAAGLFCSIVGCAPYLPFIIGGGIVQVLTSISTLINHDNLDKARSFCDRYFGKACRDVLGYIGWFALDFTNPTNVMIFGGAACLSIGALWFIPSWMNRFFKTFRTQDQTSFVGDSPSNIKLNEIERDTNAGRSSEKIPIFGQKTWNTRVIVGEKSAFTGNPLELYQSLTRRIIRCAFENPATGMARHGYIFGWRKQYAITNTHLVWGGNTEIVIKMSPDNTHPYNGSLTESITILPSMIKDIGGDVSVIFLRTKKFKDVSKHVSNAFDYPEWAHAMIEGDLVTATFSKNPIVAKQVSTGEKITYENSFVYSWPHHREGACGLPLIFRKDAGWSIVGIHSAGREGSHEGRATPILRDVVETAISALTTSCRTMETYSETIPCIDFESPSPKSIFRYENLQLLEYFGKCPGPVLANQESKLKKSYLYSVVPSLFLKEMNFVADQTFGPPLMKAITSPEYISPWNNGIKKMSVQRKSLNTRILDKCVDRLTERIVSMLKERGITSLNPFNVVTAINGDPLDPFFRRIDPSKSAGFGFPGAKNQHIPIVASDLHLVTREPSDKLKERIAHVLSGYLLGEAGGFVYTAQLKDEPRETSKIKSGNTRLFYVSPIDALVVARMFLGPFYTLMVEHGDIFCTAIGVDMHRDAHEMYQKISKFSHNIMEGDYSKYDLQMPFDIGLAACTVIFRVLKALGYNDTALACTQGILTDSMFPFVEALKDVFCMPALQPSGKYATAEDNSLRGILLLMYAWYFNPSLREKDFFDHVLPLVYGDDLLAAVKDDVSNDYNNIYYSEFCQKEIGMTFTSTSKGDVTASFVDPDTMSFLKRKFVMHKALNRYVAQLDLNSIMKTLMWTIPSSSVSPAEQELSILQSSCRELYFHLSEKVYTSLRHSLIEKYCEKFCVEFPLVHKHVPTYDFLSMELCVESSDDRIPFFSSHNDLLDYEYTKTTERLAVLNPVYVKFLDVFSGSSLYEIKSSSRYSGDRDFRRLVDSYYVDVNEYLSLVDTLERLTKYRSRSRLILESKEEDIGSTETGIDLSNQTKLVNVQEISGEMPYRTTTGITVPNPLLDSTIISLDQYFARPAKILEFAWSIDSGVYQHFSIWDLYFSRPSVRAKLLKYALIKCKLHIRVSVSGMAFHYGKLMVSYVPLYGANPMAFAYIDGSTTSHGNLNKYLSATPGAKIIDVKSNMPLDMEIPYINFTPACRLYNNSTSVISGATSLGDFVNMGEVVLSSLNDLKATTADASSVSVMVLAWATDVELSGPTNTQLAIVTESKDERISGPVEKTASSLAHISNMATVIPSIAPLARASAMVFQGLAQFSSLFGFSVPTINTAPNRMKNEPLQNAVNVIGYDTGHRLTMDPKQEITVDPRRVGVTEDEMAISAFCERQALLDQFSWSHTAPQLQSIWACAINPRVCKTYYEAKEEKHYAQPTPMGYAAAPFRYWRGDIEFTFQFVISNFHRGKIGIGFDPNIAQYALTAANVRMDGINIFVVDIQEAQEITVCVKWMHSRAWLQVNGTYQMIRSVGTISNVSQMWDYANGFIFVFPITRCQSPDDSDVQINVFQRSTNMNFNFLDEEIPLNMDYHVESKDTVVQSTCVDLNPSSSSIDDIFAVHFGERWLSFAQVCKRFETTVAITVPETTATWGTTLSVSPFVIPYLSPNMSVNATEASKTMMSYIRNCFLGMSGGIRKRIRFVGMDPSGATGRLNVFIDPPADTDSIIAVTGANNTYTATKAIGTASFVTHTQAGVEFEIPFYSNNLFIPSAMVVPYTNGFAAFQTRGMRSYTVEAECRSGNAGGYFVEESAAAEDWRCFRFIGVPPSSMT